MFKFCIHCLYWSSILLLSSVAWQVTEPWTLMDCFPRGISSILDQAIPPTCPLWIIIICCIVIYFTSSLCFVLEQNEKKCLVSLRIPWVFSTFSLKSFISAHLLIQTMSSLHPLWVASIISEGWKDGQIWRWLAYILSADYKSFRCLLNCLGLVYLLFGALIAVVRCAVFISGLNLFSITLFYPLMD